MRKPKAIGPGEIHPAVRFSNYFEIVPGASWGPRTIEDPELIYIVAGGFLYEKGAGERWVAETGDVLWIPPDELHTLRHADLESRGVISCIHCELTLAGQWGRGDYVPNPFPRRVTHTMSDPILRDLFKRSSEVFLSFSRYRDALLSAIMTEIWIRLSEYWMEEPARSRSVRIRRMEDFLRERFLEKVSRQDLAREFSVTPEHVNAIFKKETGMTPTEFIHRERIYHAYELLTREGLSVKEVADRTGFSDPFHFSKIFKRITGVPPSHVSSPRM